MKTKPKYFLITIAERNGEQETYHDQIVEATTDYRARLKAVKICKTWYEGEEHTKDKGSDWYEYSLGTDFIMIKIHSVIPITPMAFFKRHLVK